MKKLHFLLLLLSLSIFMSSCLILTPRRPIGGYRHGYGFGHKWRHHHHHGYGPYHGAYRSQ